jgi:hypothetical protein
LDNLNPAAQSQLAVVFNRCLAGGDNGQQQQQQQVGGSGGGGGGGGGGPDLEGFLLGAAAVCGLEAPLEEGAKVGPCGCFGDRLAYPGQRAHAGAGAAAES